MFSLFPNPFFLFRIFSYIPDLSVHFYERNLSRTGSVKGVYMFSTFTRVAPKNDLAGYLVNILTDIRSILLPNIDYMERPNIDYYF